MPWFETTVEVIKNVGSIGGLASSIFLVYDRFMRGRPHAFIRAHGYGAELFICNTANESIIVDDVQTTPHVIGIAKTTGLHSTIEAAAKYVMPDAVEAERIFVMLAPREERGLPIIGLVPFKEASDELPVKIEGRWRNTRKPLPIYRYFTVRTTVGDLRAIRAIALMKREEHLDR
jgi:hypothetical protein